MAGLPTVSRASPNFILQFTFRLQFTFSCNALVHDPAVDEKIRAFVDNNNSTGKNCALTIYLISRTCQLLAMEPCIAALSKVLHSNSIEVRSIYLWEYLCTIIQASHKIFSTSPLLGLLSPLVL